MQRPQFFSSRRTVYNVYSYFNLSTTPLRQRRPKRVPNYQNNLPTTTSSTTDEPQGMLYCKRSRNLIHSARRWSSYPEKKCLITRYLPITATSPQLLFSVLKVPEFLSHTILAGKSYLLVKIEQTLFTSKQDLPARMVFPSHQGSYRRGFYDKAQLN